MCGNGIVEGTEECDCGSNSTCKSNDACCKIGECLLEANATCRYSILILLSSITIIIIIVQISIHAALVIVLHQNLVLSAVEEMNV